MTFTEFTSIVDSSPGGVVLLEGRRTIPETYADAARRLAVRMAERFPDLRFRSGNAEGADQAFSEGVAGVDSARLQVVLPYESHRKNARLEKASYVSPQTIPPSQLEGVIAKTISASPKNKGLITKRNQNGSLSAKADYLLRDTLKVTGDGNSLAKPICALLYVNLEDPMEGGTGHTIRVCQQEGVPFAFQDSWELWLDRF